MGIPLAFVSVMILLYVSKQNLQRIIVLFRFSKKKKTRKPSLIKGENVFSDFLNYNGLFLLGCSLILFYFSFFLGLETWISKITMFFLAVSMIVLFFLEYKKMKSETWEKLTTGSYDIKDVFTYCALMFWGSILAVLFLPLLVAEHYFM